MDLARFALEKRLISFVATFLILFAGYFAYTVLPRFEDPEFVIRQAQIITPYPGATATEVVIKAKVSASVLFRTVIISTPRK